VGLARGEEAERLRHSCYFCGVAGGGNA
jgi:hypothetical protein